MNTTVTAHEPLGHRPLFEDFTRAAWLAVAYAAVAMFGLGYAVVGSSVTLVWAPSGIALAGVLLYGRRMAWGIALGAFVANAATGIGLLPSLSVAVGNTAEALVGAWLLQRLACFDAALRTRRDVFAFIILAAGISTMVSASIGSLTLLMAQAVPADQLGTAWLIWWLGDMMGVLVVAPVLLAWKHRVVARPSLRELLEALALIAALLFVSHRIFGAPAPMMNGHYMASLAVCPFVIWGAVRFRLSGASGVTVLISILAVWGTARGTGPFAGGEVLDSMMRWCAFAIVAAITGLLLAALVSEQRWSQEQLQASHQALEMRVTERTRDLAEANAQLLHSLQERRRLEAELIRASEAQQRRIGQDLHDGLGQQLTSIALLSGALQQSLVLAQAGEASAEGERSQNAAAATKALRITQLANEAVHMLRTVARGLSPVALEHGGLHAGLEQLALHTQQSRAVTCVYQGSDEVQITDTVLAINLYRIAQEAVHNALKHSQATEVHIDLARVAQGVALTVRDNGTGFRPELMNDHEGLGLHSMAHRAVLLGGGLQVISAPGQGTRIVVTYPEPETSS